MAGIRAELHAAAAAALMAGEGAELHAAAALMTGEGAELDAAAEKVADEGAELDAAAALVSGEGAELQRLHPSQAGVEREWLKKRTSTESL